MCRFTLTRSAGAAMAGARCGTLLEVCRFTPASSAGTAMVGARCGTLLEVRRFHTQEFLAVNADGTVKWEIERGSHSSTAIGLDGTVYFAST